MNESRKLRGLRFIPPEDLEEKAQRFLRDVHPEMSVPVPIEAIVEFDLDLEIVPIPDLWRRYEVDGFLSFDTQRIFVDEWQMERRETRYRFTLAHEVGHFILHRDLYADAGVTDLESYLDAYESMSDEDQSRWEFQARNLGGRILLPKEPFLSAVAERLEPLRTKIPKNVDTKVLCGRLAKAVAPAFNVHEAVAETRLFGDSLCEELGMKKAAKVF